MVEKPLGKCLWSGYIDPETGALKLFDTEQQRDQALKEIYPNATPHPLEENKQVLPDGRTITTGSW